MSDDVRTSFEGGVARLTLNNPERKNAISLGMAGAITDFCDRALGDRSIGAVIIDAEGTYFCSGADTRDLALTSSSPASSDGIARTSAVYDAFVRFGSLPIPSIAVVRGGAVGAGLNLALAADVMLLTPDAVLDSGFATRGIHPGGGHLRLLGRNLGFQQAMAMAAFGVRLDAERAVELGIALAVHRDAEISFAADRLAQGAASDPELARRIKQSALIELEAPGLSWSAAVEIERGVQMWSFARKGEDGWRRASTRVTREAGR